MRDGIRKAPTRNKYKYSQCCSFAVRPDRHIHWTSSCLQLITPILTRLKPTQTNGVSSSPGRRGIPTLTHLTENTPAQRRGPKGYFQGSRKKFLEDYLPTYVSYTKGNRHKFWHDLFNVWWQRYPWKLNDKQEPPTDDSEKMTRLASVGPGDRAIKAAVEEKLTEVRSIPPLSID